MAYHLILFGSVGFVAALVYLVYFIVTQKLENVTLRIDTVAERVEEMPHNREAVLKQYYTKDQVNGLFVMGKSCDERHLAGEKLNSEIIRAVTRDIKEIKESLKALPETIISLIKSMKEEKTK